MNAYSSWKMNTDVDHQIHYTVLYTRVQDLT